MALWHCTECTTPYAVGLPACPHCWSTSKLEDGPVPKITKAGGPSHEGDVPAAVAEPVVEPVTEPVAVVEPEPEPAPRKRGKNVTVARAQVAEGKGAANQ